MHVASWFRISIPFVVHWAHVRLARAFRWLKTSSSWPLSHSQFSRTWRKLSDYPVSSPPLMKEPLLPLTNISSPHQEVAKAQIPFTLEDCRTCPNPCDEGHAEYPRLFDVDWTSNMLGEVKPYRRQLVISTGKSDWAHDITDNKNSLAALLQRVPSQIPLPASPTRSSSSTSPLHKRSRSASASNSNATSPPHKIKGVFTPTDTTRTAVLNGSHHSLSDDSTSDTVLVFPEYKVVTDVARSIDGAQDLLEELETLQKPVSAFLLPHSSTGLRSWILPYSSVILLCSHKKRDNRCAIAAPKLKAEFTRCLEYQGWEVDTQIQEPDFDFSFNLDPSATSSVLPRELQALKRVLILYTSHVGGHKYAGNVIIHTPAGSSIWYGRVTPHDVKAIVEHTLINGVIIPSLLRGGLNLTKPGCQTLHDW